MLLCRCLNSYEWHHSYGHSYGHVVDNLRMEHGRFRLSDAKKDDMSRPQWRHTTDTWRDELVQFVLHEKDVELVLDAVDLSIQHCLDCYIELKNAGDIDIDDYYDVRKLISELNDRFQEDGFGYQIEGRKVIQVNSKFIHSEVTVPALSILSNIKYAGANDEFLKAHEHYLRGDYKGVIMECSKAFESVMKSICNMHGWAYKKSDTARALIEICLGGGLVPSSLQSQLTGLRTLLESGVPTIRNRNAAHGQGERVIPMPRHVAAYALHITASTVVFLADAQEELRKS